MGTEYTISVLGTNSAGDGVSASDTVSTIIDRELLHSLCYQSIDCFYSSISFALYCISYFFTAPSIPQDFQGVSTNPFTIFASWEDPKINGGLIPTPP